MLHCYFFLQFHDLVWRLERPSWLLPGRLNYQLIFDELSWAFWKLLIGWLIQAANQIATIYAIVKKWNKQPVNKNKQLQNISKLFSFFSTRDFLNVKNPYEKRPQHKIFITKLLNFEYNKNNTIEKNFCVILTFICSAKT